MDSHSIESRDQVEDVLGLGLDPDVVEEANGHTNGAEFHEMSLNYVLFKQLLYHDSEGLTLLEKRVRAFELGKELIA
ncbi:hypothetical protein OIDMADRAFT_55788 [Oidiodendron maius Zn]|uniref:Uncharacterized protein n=1 Tax=Oidiodendron maius (strain Zn) TaxID=913774 RepID=A0A0C3GUX2_OIDMZ|nr:hypothetical protein OIDMADRAFT_55788 [Oidiodendron maius Zn]